MSVTLVCGPPGAGKSSWVSERAGHGDLVWDHDLVAWALSGGRLERYDRPRQLLPFVMAARRGVFRELVSSPVRGWVILSEPKATRRERIASQLGAEIVVLDVDPNRCMRNILNDPNRGLRSMQLTQPLIDKWWKDYTT